MAKHKIERVVYRLWHNKSSRGRIGYIGKDKYYPHRSTIKYRAKDKTTPKLFLAFKKYPLKFWKVEILASGLKTDKSLIKAEIFFIKKFDSKNKGYNCTDGGDGRRGFKHSQEFKDRLSKRFTGKRNHNWGRKTPARVRKKISDALKGRKGRKHTEATKKKISLAHRGRKHRLWGKRHAVSVRRKMSLSHKRRWAKLKEKQNART